MWKRNKKIIDSSNWPTTAVQYTSRETPASHTEKAPSRQNLRRQGFVTSDLFLCSAASSPRPPPQREVVGARPLACRLPTVPQRIIYLSVNVIMVQMAAAERLF